MIARSKKKLANYSISFYVTPEQSTTDSLFLNQNIKYQRFMDKSKMTSQQFKHKLVKAEHIKEQRSTYKIQV